VNFDRPRLDGLPPSEDKPITPDETIFAGSLIDVATGKMGSGRPACEAAGDALANVVIKSAKSVSKEPVAAAAW
jgi:hypothetical protein